MSGDCLQAVLTKVQVWMRQLRHVISNKSLVQARWEKVQAFISSRLDLCSALLHGLPDTAETPAIGTVCYRMAINQCTTARPHHTDTRQYAVRRRVDFMIAFLVFPCLVKHLHLVT